MIYAFFLWLFGAGKQIDRIERLLIQLVQRDTQMAATLQDLDAAIAAEGTEITTLIGAVNAVANDINNLIQDIKDGKGVDVTKELTAIQANTANIATAVAAAQAADQVANPPGSSNFGEVPKQ